MDMQPIITQDQDYKELVLLHDALQTNSQSIEFVLDFNRLGDVIGIEIVNLKAICGNQCLELIEAASVCSDSWLHHSYDKECDSFYLKLANEPSFNQKAVDGEVLLTDKKQIVGFKWLD